MATKSNVPQRSTTTRTLAQRWWALARKAEGHNLVLGKASTHRAEDHLRRSIDGSLLVLLGNSKHHDLELVAIVLLEDFRKITMQLLAQASFLLKRDLTLAR